ncbi:MAG: DUF362 domain-containing protein [Planctomycetota bacterium]|jgi:uncharacterized protein (DUF362 family)
MQNYRISETPFKINKQKPDVFIASGKGAYQNTLDALSNIDLTPASGKKVLLKPNAGRLAKKDSGITTNPEVVAAVIDAFRKVDAVVAVGESPISGVKTAEAFEITGIAEVCRERNCPMIDLDKKIPMEVSVENGKAINELKVCADLLEYDIIVSIPVMKMHMHTLVTLSIKNMKGCLWRRSKVKLHMLPEIKDIDCKPIDVAIADMSEILKPHLAIIDGSACLEGLGPSAGNAKNLDLVIAGTEPFACDAAASHIMGVDPHDVAHLHLAAERGFGILDLDKINVTPDNWQDLVDPFERPPENIAIDFPGIKILDKNSCSACQSTLLLFLKRYGESIFEYFPEQKEIAMAIGKGHDDLPEGTVCIGNCTIKHQNKGIFVKGCPPVASEILSRISGKESFDVKDGEN